MKNQYLIYLFILIALSGCSVLSDSQLKNINVYATAATSYSNYPGEVIRYYAKLNQDNRILKTSNLKDIDAVNAGLDSARKNYNFRINLAADFDLSLQLFRQYAALLAKLSSPDYITDLNTNSTALGENNTSLVKQYNAKAGKKLPDEIGTKLSDAVFIAGKRWIKSRQSKALKEFIPAGNVLIGTITDNLVTTLEGDATSSGSVRELISFGKSDFKDQYQIIVLTKPGGINYPSLKVYYETLARFDSLEAMRTQCVLTAKKIKTEHEKLTQDIQSKKKLKEIFSESADLITDVRKLKNAYQTLVN